jgi:CBS domain-containing protein
MIARDVMTRDVVSVAPDTPVRKIASILVKNRISAVPVVDRSGMPIGIVSEGDLIGRKEAEREATGLVVDDARRRRSREPRIPSEP